RLIGLVGDRSEVTRRRAKRRSRKDRPVTAIEELAAVREVHFFRDLERFDHGEIDLPDAVATEIGKAGRKCAQIPVELLVGESIESRDIKRTIDAMRVEVQGPSVIDDIAPIERGARLAGEDGVERPPANDLADHPVGIREQSLASAK